MSKQFDVRVYGAGYMGADLWVKATTDQIEGRDQCAFWNGVFRRGHLPIGNAAGWTILKAEVEPMSLNATCGNKTFHDVVVLAKGAPLANGRTGDARRTTVATVFAEPGEIQPTVLA